MAAFQICCFIFLIGFATAQAPKAERRSIHRFDFPSSEWNPQDPDFFTVQDYGVRTPRTPPPRGHFFAPYEDFTYLLESGPAPNPMGMIPYHDENDLQPVGQQPHQGENSNLSQIASQNQPLAFDNFTQYLFAGHQSSPYRQEDHWGQEQGGTLQASASQSQFQRHDPMTTSESGPEIQFDPASGWHHRQHHASIGSYSGYAEPGEHESHHIEQDGYESGEVSPSSYGRLGDAHAFNDNDGYGNEEMEANLPNESSQIQFLRMWDEKGLNTTHFGPLNLAEQVMRISTFIPTREGFRKILDEKLRNANRVYKRRFFDRLMKLRELMDDVRAIRIYQEGQSESSIWKTQADRENDLNRSFDLLNGVGYKPHERTQVMMRKKLLTSRAFLAAKLMQEFLNRDKLSLLHLSRTILMSELELLPLTSKDLKAFENKRSKFIRSLLFYLHIHRVVSGPFNYDLLALADRYYEDEKKSEDAHRSAPSKPTQSSRSTRKRQSREHSRRHGR